MDADLEWCGSSIYLSTACSSMPSDSPTKYKLNSCSTYFFLKEADTYCCKSGPIDLPHYAQVHIFTYPRHRTTANTATGDSTAMYGA